ncbi:MAG: CCA tRNA nucleotidyltransferase, partial [Crenarchaeota archaeon]|nr:CCA tRNA nucleotidyltransferase [Thermoproteota archaeon]
MQSAKTKEILQQVLEEITPTLNEKQKMKKIAKNLRQKVADACKEFSIDVIVRLEGSVAKDTWIRDNPDIDIFLQLPTSIQRNQLDEISLKIAFKATQGFKQIQRFAEHPYLETYVENTRVNIVPCYHATPGKWISATDRTPFHTDFINKNMNKTMQNQVRLLKKFMKSIEVYGAEIKVGGFSGYLCELLILHYGSFNDVIETFANPTPKLIIDINNFYENKQNEIEKIFPEQIVIIDPVDKARNVASAVQTQQLYTFTAACQCFLKSPRKIFFNPPKTTRLPKNKIVKNLKQNGSDLLFVIFEQINTVPDILWGQLYKTKKSLKKLLELNDFNVLRDTVWSEEGNKETVLIYELEQNNISLMKKHYGPPLIHKTESEKFLSKYVNDRTLFSGPYIEETRWVIQLPRKYNQASTLLKAKLKDGGKSVGVAELVSQSIKRKNTILINEEIIKVY